jgi:hypothetical protein
VHRAEELHRTSEPLKIKRGERNGSAEVPSLDLEGRCRLSQSRAAASRPARCEGKADQKGMLETIWLAAMMR